MDLIVLFLAFAVGWGVLRSMGGSGLDVMIEFAPKSTKQGMRQRWIVAGVLLLWCGSLVFVEAYNDDASTAKTLLFMSIIATVTAYALYKRGSSK